MTISKAPNAFFSTMCSKDAIFLLILARRFGVIEKVRSYTIAFIIGRG